MYTKYKEGWFLPEEDKYFESALLDYPAENDGKRIYQFHHIDRCFHYLQTSKKRIAIDVGAHIGFWSYYLCKNFGHVHSFEPIESHIECFKKNVTNTNFTLHEIGLGNKKAKTSFNIPVEISGMASVNDKKEGEIPMLPLDTFNFNEVDFIKIDVEGYEKFVIEGAKYTILRNKPIIILEEKEHSGLYGLQRYSAVTELQNMGLIVLERVVDDFIMGWQN